MRDSFSERLDLWELEHQIENEELRQDLLERIAALKAKQGSEPLEAPTGGAGGAEHDRPKKERYPENQRAIDRIRAGESQEVVFGDWQRDRRKAGRPVSDNLKDIFKKSVLRHARERGEESKVP